MGRTTSVLIVIASLGAACDSAAPEPNVPVDQRISARSAPSSVAGTVPGYVHSLSHSKFRAGDNVAIELDGHGLERWRGGLGAFALDTTNGWTMAVLDATSPTGPYNLDEADQAQRVKLYFIGAGIPAEQVAAVGSTFIVAGGGAVSDTTSKPPALESINSVLSRSVGGIRVVESFAWAKMTTSGDVDMEAVFWPSIDNSVVDRATAFATSMRDTATANAYRAKLPGTIYRDDGVVIHHSDFSIHSSPTAYVSYDVTLRPDQSAAMRHFDENGVEFRLPHELLTPAASAGVRTR